MKKRNRRTVIMANVKLAPLTEQILNQMGPEGADIRKRLKIFYGKRSYNEQSDFEEFKHNFS
jgi:hypothetical protein